MSCGNITRSVYVMAMHSAPTDGGAWPEAHLPYRVLPPHRRTDRLKYLAGVELGVGAFVNDTRPEDTGIQLRKVVTEVAPRILAEVTRIPDR